jgi:endonuclease YncB( thermonuclease family)
LSLCGDWRGLAAAAARQKDPAHRPVLVLVAIKNAFRRTTGAREAASSSAYTGAAAILPPHWPRSPCRSGACNAQQLCPSAGNASGRVVSVDERLDLTLEDGTRLKIGGIDPARPTPADPDLDERGREILAKWPNWQTVAFRPLEPQHDRWGRVIGMVFAPVPQISERQSQRLLPVGEAIIDAGLARYKANTPDDPCRGSLLAAEREARTSGLGLWADQYYAIIATGDRDSFAENAGSTVIVEGRVTGLNVRRPKITLYFGPPGFSVTILPRGSKAFAAAQTRLAGLTGQTIRVRGLLDTRFGPQIEISALDALEVVGQEQSASGTLK